MLLDGESSVSFFPSSLLILICWTAKASISMLLLLLLLLCQLLMMMMKMIYNYAVKAAAGCIPGGNNYSSQSARAR